MRALNREYIGELSTLHAVRRDVARFLTEQGADAATLERASLIASELASNAIQASPGRPYQLRAWSGSPGVVSLSIRNHDAISTPPPRASWPPRDALASRGRGLSIVDSLSEEVTVETEGNEIIVTARLRISTG